jgi:hypothetical protein
MSLVAIEKSIVLNWSNRLLWKVSDSAFEMTGYYGKSMVVKKITCSYVTSKVAKEFNCCYGKSMIAKAVTWW